MKYLIALSLVAFCVYQLTSIQAAPNSRMKRELAYGYCPANASTAEECLNYAREQGYGKGCSSVYANGKVFTIVGCGTVSCYIGGQEIVPKADLSKPHPKCCPTCDGVLKKHAHE